MLAVLCAGSLAACDTVQQNQRTAIGAGVGAAAGAGLGTLVGGNDRRNALVGAGIGLLAGAAVGQYLDRQQRALQEDLAGTGAEVVNTGQELRITFPEAITFPTDSATLSPAFTPVIGDVAATLRQYPESYIDVVGHTDSTGADAYNQQLSERRAQAVSNALTAQGVNPARVVAYGLGETQPVASNDTLEGRAQNRRVELRIVPATGPA